MMFKIKEGLIGTMRIFEGKGHEIGPLCGECGTGPAPKLECPRCRGQGIEPGVIAAVWSGKYRVIEPIEGQWEVIEI
jgi:hypothetical protein